MAVGGAQATTGVALTEIWNGTLWRVLPSPNPANAVLGTLAGISCLSVSNCQAVGYYQLGSGNDLTLIAAWNGTSWRIEPSASRGVATELFGMACPAVRECVAVGGATEPVGHAADAGRGVETGSASGCEDSPRADRPAPPNAR